VHHEHENDWTRWRFTESLRRNVFFVHMINSLGARARKLNQDYFEPLGDEMVLHLPLPAPEYEYALSQTLYWLLKMDRMGMLDASGLLPVTRMVLACSKIAPGVW
jgi:hypothetical protein